MSTSTALRTPLYSEHLAAGAKIINFGGWEMPVYYTSIMEEHLAVRESVGMFDISHMGQIIVSRAGAGTFLNRMLTNNLDKISTGHGQYTFLLNEAGGVIDDLIAYLPSPDEYFLVVNAGKIEEDFAWLEKNCPPEVSVKNHSNDYAGIAVQGPQAIALLTSFLGIMLPPRSCVVEIIVHDTTFLVGRTGYTGEDGAEIFFPAAEAVQIWKKLLALGVKPCGLGARDTLRLEVCYPLNGSDLSPTRTPLEAGLGFFVDLEKEKFTGRTALLAQKKNGLAEKLTPFTMIPPSPPPRAHYPVLAGGRVIGETTSGGLSPSLKQGIGLAYLPVSHTAAGTPLEIDIRGKKFAAVVIKKPFYKKP